MEEPADLNIYGVVEIMGHRTRAGILSDASIWKCDRLAHPNEVLPPLPSVPGLSIANPADLLSDEQKEALRSDLERMARQRRTAGGSLA